MLNQINNVGKLQNGDFTNLHISKIDLEANSFGKELKCVFLSLFLFMIIKSIFVVRPIGNAVEQLIICHSIENMSKGLFLSR